MKNILSKTSCLEEIPNEHIGELKTSNHEIFESKLKPSLLGETTKKILEEKLKLESTLVSHESLNVLKEFETI